MEPSPEYLQEEVKNLRLAVEELSLLNEIALASASLDEVNAVIDLTVSKTLKRMQAEQGCIMRVSDDQTSPFITYNRKIERTTSQLPIHVSNHLMGWMMRYQVPLLINDLAADQRFANVALKAEFRSILMVPLKHHNKLTGLFAIFNKAGDFTLMDQRLLGILAPLVGQLIHEKEEEKKRREVENEQEVARRIQMGLLPKSIPQVPGYEFYGLTQPSKQVGGDYFDFLQLPNGCLGIALGDASGKGTPAALLIANLQAVLRTRSLDHSELKATIENANKLLCRSVEPGMFVTLAYAALSPDSRKFSYVNAGHCPPLLFSKGKVYELNEGGLILGVQDQAPYQEGEVELASGDLLLIYSDGVNEAINPQDEQFGDKRLIELVQSNLSLSAESLAHKILHDVALFEGSAGQADDITLVIVKVK